MKKILNLLLNIVRPGKKIDDEIELSYLFYECTLLFFALIRGGLLKLRGSKGWLPFIGKGAVIFQPSSIFFGKNVRLNDYTRVSGVGSKGLIIGNNVSIGAFSRIMVSSGVSNIGSHIIIGDGVGIGEYSSLGGSGGLIIGNDTIIAQYFSAHPENHVYSDCTKSIKDQGTVRAEIKIGTGCWFGSKVTVLAGVTIGDHCVIGAGAVVTSDIPSYSIAVGNPAKVIRKING